MKVKKIPQRSCIGCGTKKDKKDGALSGEQVAKRIVNVRFTENMKKMHK